MAIPAGVPGGSSSVQGTGQNDVHAAHGMNIIIPSTGSSQVLTSEAFVI
jgi:hypothetical protein